MWYDRPVRSRGLASTVVGVSLAVLIALASIVAGWAIWERASERQQADDERASLSVGEALATSVGRSLAIMRASSGLVEPDGSVDTGTFFGFARGITVVGSANAVVLARAVPAAGRARFEAAERRPIIQVVRPGVYERAPARARYLPVVAVWPDTPVNQPLLGLDLLRDAARRRAADEAARRRDTVLTSLIPLAVNRQGFLAFQPLYAPGRARGRPVAYVTASFATDLIARELARLASEFRIRVTSGDATVYVTSEPPGGGDRRTLMLAGSPWVVRAEGRPASRLEPFVVAGTGIALAALLALFAFTRASSERRLLRANVAAERALDRSEALARDAELLATVGEALEQSTTAEGRARRLVDTLVDGGIRFAAVHLGDEETGALEDFAVAGARPPELADDAVWLAHVRRAVAAMGVLPVRARGGDEEPELVVLPLRARGRALGTLTLDAPGGGDLRAVSTGLAREVAGVAALALDNARLYERERGVSHALQLGLLGKAPSFANVVDQRGVPSGRGGARDRWRLVRRVRARRRLGRARRGRRRRARARRGGRDGSAARRGAGAQPCRGWAGACAAPARHVRRERPRRRGRDPRVRRARSRGRASRLRVRGPSAPARRPTRRRRALPLGRPLGAARLDPRHGADGGRGAARRRATRSSSTRTA